MGNILSALFGTKADRDLKELEPIKNRVLEAYESIKELTNDGLRAKTAEFRQLIHDTVKEEEDRIAETGKTIIE